MTAPKLILFNGPPRSGKDTAANWAQAYCLHNRHVPYRRALASYFFDIMAPILALPAAELIRTYEEEKDVKKYNGHSLRELIIKFSQTFAWPIFGDNFLAVRTADQFVRPCLESHDSSVTARMGPPVFIISDLGRPSELLPFLPFFAPENILIIRLYRYGSSFDGDCRQYVYTPGSFLSEGKSQWDALVEIKGCAIENLSISMLVKGVEGILTEFLSSK